MNIRPLTIPLVVITAIFLSTAVPLIAEAKSEIYKNWLGLAIKGYDTVAYHKDGKPVEGSKNYELKWKDAKWRFASPEHRDLFKTNPKKCAPVRRVLCLGRLSGIHGER